MLSESQRKKILYNFTYMLTLKETKPQTHRTRDQLCGNQRWSMSVKGEKGIGERYNLSHKINKH